MMHSHTNPNTNTKPNCQQLKIHLKDVVLMQQNYCKMLVVLFFVIQQIPQTTTYLRTERQTDRQIDLHATSF